MMLAFSITNRLSVRVFLCALLCVGGTAHASVALLMEEPFGEFGAFNPTGHAAIYLNHVCAASFTELRRCEPGEYGTVISRYHKIHREDWIAMPLVDYLYAVSSVNQIPQTITRDGELELRRTYWREHLQELAPAKKDGSAPKGEWDQLIGSALDRRIHGFVLETTDAQDEQLIAYFNDHRNVGHFNLFFHNCADFARVLLDMYFPHSIHRNYIADGGLTTPKQVTRSLVKYGQAHPELHMIAFIIPQVPGTIPRSHTVDGVAESLVKSKRYLIPLAFLAPEFTGGVALSYLADGRLHLPKNAAVFNVGDLEIADSEMLTVAHQQSAGSERRQLMPGGFPAMHKPSKPDPETVPAVQQPDDRPSSPPAAPAPLPSGR